MRPARTDREAEQLLQQLDQLHAADPETDIEPPALVDQSVRNMARRELQRPAQLPPIAGKLRWIAGLATVSIAMIAVGISLTQTPQTPLPADAQEEAQDIDFERHRKDSAEYPQPAAPEAYSSAPAMTKQSAPESPVAAAEKRTAEPATADLVTAASGAKSPAEEADDPEHLAESQSAEAWLELILQLHDQGLHTEAQHELQAFERQYPDFPLPDWAVRLLPHQP